MASDKTAAMAGGLMRFISWMYMFASVEALLV